MHAQELVQVYVILVSKQNFWKIFWLNGSLLLRHFGLKVRHFVQTFYLFKCFGLKGRLFFNHFGLEPFCLFKQLEYLCRHFLFKRFPWNQPFASNILDYKKDFCLDILVKQTPFNVQTFLFQTKHFGFEPHFLCGHF